MTPAAAASPGRKSTVAVLLLCVATISLLMFILLASYSPRLQPHGRSPHRRLKLHPKNSAAVASSYGTGESGGSGAQHHHAAPFDPAIAELERQLEDKEWEREHYRLLHGDGEEKDDHMKEWEEFLKEEEDFINDDDRFNVSDRIRALFPKIDLNPQDGFVSLDELIRWNLEQARGDQLHRSAREMELYDKNGDGIVSFGDFQTLRKESHGEGNSLGFPWWKEEHFNASDANGDGFLNKAEFHDFLNPSDSDNPKVINLLCRQELRQRDKDGDGKLTFEEYFHGLHDHIHGYDDENAEISHIGNMTIAKERFSKLGTLIRSSSFSPSQA